MEHARASTERWKSSHNRPFPNIEWVHGNALTINPNKGEAVVGFDRIYVGSSVDKEDLPKLAFLLRPGGILVGPGMSNFCHQRAQMPCLLAAYLLTTFTCFL